MRRMVAGLAVLILASMATTALAQRRGGFGARARRDPAYEARYALNLAVPLYDVG